jgi:phytanoyl-CoA hydroxylase
MTYPTATPQQVAFYREHGWLVVEDAIPQDALDLLEERCEKIIREKERFAFDWAWDAKEKKEERSFKIIQSSPSLVWDTIAEQPYRNWLTAFSEALMDMKMELFLDMLLAKPPEKSVPTYWHQDEGYWGRNLCDRGITCWIPLHDVDAKNGCMHFIDVGHKDGILTHRIVEGVASDLLTCDVDESRMVVCPIKRGDVTFHHSKTPHMTTANTSDRYRKAVTNHLQETGAGGEGGHYPWKIYVDQRTGKVTVPERG